MADFNIKRGDTWPPIDAVLSDDDGPIDLTSATTVKIIFKTPGAGSTTFNGTCTITDALSGAVRYVWGPTDTATVNTYNVEYEITWTDSTKTTIPTIGYKTVEVLQDLG